jgi:glycosyltransferase involved in cell wall biosynthesis
MTGNPHSKYDVTLIGMISYQSACKLPGLWIDNLSKDCSINFIPTCLMNLDSASETTKLVAQNPDKTPGAVSILLDNVIWTPQYCSYRYVPDSPIKIVLSMLEASKMIPQCVQILNTTFDAVIVPDDYWIKIYKDSGVTIPIFVLPCGLDLDGLLSKQLPSKPHTTFTFGFSGAFWERKNHVKVLEAFAQEFGNDPHVRLKLHGRGGYQSILNELGNIIQKYRLDNVAIFTDQFTQQQFEDFMTSLDVYVLVSTAEGYSISPREAMALGIPCIVSNNTAHITLCNSGFVRAVKAEIPRDPDQYETLRGIVDRGIQFDCTVEDVRAALKDVYTNYQAYLEKAAQAREWVRRYSFSTLKRKHLNFIKPPRVILADENKVEDDCLITNDVKLYTKYLKIIH